MCRPLVQFCILISLAVIFAPCNGTSDDGKESTSETVWPVRDTRLSGEGTFKTTADRKDKSGDESSWSRVVYTLHRHNGKKPFILDLTIEENVIGPRFIVKSVRKSMQNNQTWIKTNNRDGSDGENDVWSCLYTGRVIGDPHSKVVVSICNGMMGQIHTSKDGEFSIEPIRDSNYRKSSSATAHIAHRMTKLVMREFDATFQKMNPPLRHRNHHKGHRHSHSRIKRQDGDEGSEQWDQKKNKSKDRVKRSFSVEQHIEVMVVADNLMGQYYQNDLQLYVLTLMSIVRLIYHDASIGNLMNVAVVKLLVMDEYEDNDILKSANVSTILKKFCRWQQSHNIDDDSHPYHHDTAILITRKDICLETSRTHKCEILGLAEVGKLCDHRKSCSVVEDTGLSTAFTIAHELGHVLNIPHDGEKTCDRFNKNNTKSFLMAAVMSEESDPWSWSRCSRHFLTEFLDSDDSKCILDKPISNMNNIEDEQRHLQFQPGELYNASQQCQLLYSTGYRPCYDIINERPCQMLWCEGPDPGDGCISKHSPWADGTDCGLNMWCQRGECVQKNYRSLVPVNGHWSEWSAYSTCSRTCGGGIAQSQRYCDSPRPKNGGRYCLGRRMRYKSCNSKDCIDGEKSFRDHQCEVFDGINFDLKNIPAHPKWVPKFYTEVPEKDTCRLICSVNGTSMYHVLKDKVIDGTPCRPDSFDICVNGKCLKAGCDHILGSNSKVDMCNVCEGNNSTCRVVSGTFNVSRYGYNLVKVIPAGAANILIKQKGYRGLLKDDNYLALKSDDGYILNGKFILRSFALKLYFHGVEIEYSGSNTTVEKISIKRKLRRDLMLQVLTVGHLYPPDIRYQYTVPLEYDNEYKWHLEDHWSECTKVCKGEQYRRVVCVRVYDRVLVSEDHCAYQEKPESLAQVCNLHCDLRWIITQESECSSRCAKGIKKRTIKCFQEIEEDQKYPLHDRYCSNEKEKPLEEIECEGDCTEVFWKFAEWSECSKTCGGGVQSRNVECTDSNKRVLHDKECSSIPKQTVRVCNTRDCPRWEVGDWSSCSVTCGNGIRHRSYWCQRDNQVVSEAYCDKSSLPVHKKQCRMRECTSWDQGKWGPCSVSCGQGYTKRIIRCLSESGQELNPFHCDSSVMPKDMMKCDLPACTTLMTSTESSTSTLAYTYSSIYLPSTIEVVPSSKVTPPTSLSQVKPYVAQRIIPEWKAGSWTECSRACGEGVKERYVACHNANTTKRIPDNLCEASKKPNGRQMCRDRPCGYWRTGEWSECTVSCGEGIQLRHVVCMMVGSQVEVFDEQCDSNDRPTTERLCSSNPCSLPISFSNDSHLSSLTTNWFADEWGPCSKSCNGGIKKRQVKCLGFDQTEAILCDAERRPTDAIRCNIDPCPKWVTSAWSECSATCGKGLNLRDVECHSHRNQLLPSQYCDKNTKPEPTKPCIASAECPVKHQYYWQIGSWSRCSVKCGKGQRSRKVTCINQNTKVEASDEQCPNPKPITLRRCRRGACPKWRRARWSKCSSSCNGTQERVFQCRLKRRVVDPKLCSGLAKQPDKEKRVCNVKRRCLFRWRSKSWSRCSKPCGTGVIHRKAFCVDEGGRNVPERHCKRRKPRTKGRCNTHTCDYTWRTEHWSLCTHSCDIGIQTRDVTCHRVNAFGWIIPRAVHHNKCNQTIRPQSVRRCKYGDCHYIGSTTSSKGVWRVGNWKPCSTVCGRGMIRRRIRCYSHSGKRLPKKFCDVRLRPPKRKVCYLRPCTVMTCKDVQKRMFIRSDGEQNLFVHGKNTKIYCAGMNTSSPREYISLTSGKIENYAEVYSKRLLQPQFCPANGERDENCRCRNDYKSLSGLTAYNKIRINVTTLQVITTDFAFASFNGQRKIRFGEAGDCYSAAKCPQGRFSINLQNTGFVVWKDVRWKSRGNKASIKIHRSSDGLRIQGKCGGYCGNCFPNQSFGGLVLDVAPP